MRTHANRFVHYVDYCMALLERGEANNELEDGLRTSLARKQGNRNRCVII
jgi:hypothetical protein